MNFPDCELLEYENGEEQFEYVEITESELLLMLDSMEKPMNVCRRLFKINPLERSVNLSFLSMEDMINLYENGFFFLDNMIPSDLIRDVWQQTHIYLDQGKMAKAHGPNRIDQRLENVRDDLTFVFSQSTSNFNNEIMKELNSPSIEKLVDFIHSHILNDISNVIEFSGGQEYQLSYYPNNVNARYDRHRDAFPSDGSQESEFQERKLTIITYLNQKWNASDGGKLRIYLEKDHAIDIEPLPGRTLVFLSGAIDHEVLPVLENYRIAFTIWCH